MTVTFHPSSSDRSSFSTAGTGLGTSINPDEERLQFLERAQLYWFEREPNLLARIERLNATHAPFWTGISVTSLGARWAPTRS